MRIRVTVARRKSIQDPECRAILEVLHGQGLKQIKGFSQARIFDVDIEGEDLPGESFVRTLLEILHNQVLEEYEIEFVK